MHAANPDGTALEAAERSVQFRGSESQCATWKILVWGAFGITPLRVLPWPRVWMNRAQLPTLTAVDTP